MGSTKNRKIIETIEGLKHKYPNQFSYSEKYSAELLRSNLAETDIFLFPSHYKNEAAPIVILEAQTMGVFVAATNIGTIGTEVIHPGFSVEIANYQSELKKLLEYLSKLNTRNQSKSEVMNEMIRQSAKAQSDIKEVFLRWK